MPKKKHGPYRLSDVVMRIRNNTLHQEIGGMQPAIHVKLAPCHTAGLKRLAGKFGTTIGIELISAIYAHLLGLSRNDFRFLGRFGDVIRSYAPKTNRRIAEALIMTDKSFIRIAHLA